MIWIVLIVLLALTALLVAPALFRASNITAKDALTRELAASKHQLSQIDAEIASGFLDAEGAGRARRAMERRILTLGERLEALNAGKGEPALPNWLKFAVPIALVVITAGLYPLIGAPFYKPQETSNRTLTPEEQAIANMSSEELEALLIKRIDEAAPDDPTGYVFLGRVRMDLGKFDEALEAYRKALELSDNHPQVAAELAQAENFIARQRGEAPPNSAAPDINNNETANAIREMSPEEQQAQIRAMVDGLAVRLEDNPDDLQGWLRLIRARTVLGDTDLAKTHLTDARAAFENDPAAQNALDQLAQEIGLTD